MKTTAELFAAALMENVEPVVGDDPLVIVAQQSGDPLLLLESEAKAKGLSYVVPQQTSKGFGK